MTSRVSAELVAEEVNRVDQELKALQRELADTLNLNDDLAKNIEEKEEELQVKETRLQSLLERNEVDNEQMKMETDALEEKLKHETAAEEGKLKYLELQYKRFEDMVKENESLRDCINILVQQTEKDRNFHAERMHQMNKDMNTLRHEMEEKMRKELMEMDVSYQKEAFAALSDAHKKAMFQNAKLKDEVALQGVGLNNLGSRLGKQNNSIDLTRQELQRLHRKSKQLRKRIAAIVAKKNRILKSKSDVERELRTLEADKQVLETQLFTAPALEDGISMVEQLRQDIIDYKCKVDMWEKRKEMLQSLYMEVKPVNQEESIGRFNPHAFRLTGTMSLPSELGSAGRVKRHHRTLSLKLQRSDENDATSFNASTGATSTKASARSDSSPRKSVRSARSSNPDTHVHEIVLDNPLRPRDVQLAIEHDAQLHAALLPLKGREGVVLTASPDDDQQNSVNHKEAEAGYSEERDQNMVAWIVLQIFDIWSYSQCLSQEKQEQLLLELQPEKVGVQIMGRVIVLLGGEEYENNEENHNEQQELVTKGDENRDASEFDGSEARSRRLVSFSEASDSITPRGMIQKQVEQSAAPTAVEKEKKSLCLPDGPFPPAQTAVAAPGERTPMPTSHNVSGSISPRVTKASKSPVPVLQLNTRETVGKASPVSPTRAQMKIDAMKEKQNERDYIENADLSEEMLEQIFDEAYSSPAIPLMSHGLTPNYFRERSVEYDTGLPQSIELERLIDNGQSEEVTWFKRIRDPRRYPAAKAHLDILPLPELQRLAAFEQQNVVDENRSLPEENNAPQESTMRSHTLKHPECRDSGYGVEINEPRIRIPKKKPIEVGPPIVVNLIGGERERLLELAAKEAADEVNNIKKNSSSAVTLPDIHQGSGRQSADHSRNSKRKHSTSKKKKEDEKLDTTNLMELLKNETDPLTVQRKHSYYRSATTLHNTKRTSLPQSKSATTLRSSQKQLKSSESSHNIR